MNQISQIHLEIVAAIILFVSFYISSHVIRWIRKPLVRLVINVDFITSSILSSKVAESTKY